MHKVVVIGERCSLCGKAERIKGPYTICATCWAQANCIEPTTVRVIQAADRDRANAERAARLQNFARKGA